MDQRHRNPSSGPAKQYKIDIAVLNFLGIYAMFELKIGIIYKTLYKEES